MKKIKWLNEVFEISEKEFEDIELFKKEMAIKQEIENLKKEIEKLRNEIETLKIVNDGLYKTIKMMTKI